MGADIGENSKTAVGMLMSNLQPHIANMYRVTNRTWRYQSWEELVTTLLDMYRDYCFSSGRSANAKQMVQIANQSYHI